MTTPQTAKNVKWAGSDNSVPRLGLRKGWKHRYTRVSEASKWCVPSILSTVSAIRKCVELL
jgi:hypothetical protein